MTDLASYTLADRFGAETGRVSLSGTQALVRTLLDQVRADRRRGLRTAGLLAGYRGSPVGGVDAAYLSNQEIMEAHDVRFVNGVNEELGATMVWGAQQAGRHPAPRHDGVIGMWYGKGPGLDRAGDAIRHANVAGVEPTGGVLAVAGDDPACKSSTIPSASELAFADLGLPTLYPASVQELLDLGRYGYELSRASGAWVGVKVHTEIADGSAVVDVDHDRIEVVREPYLLDGEPWRQTCDDALLAPRSVALEHEAFVERPAAAQHFAAVNGLDRRLGADDAWLGLVAAGKPYLDLRTALERLGIDTEASLHQLGIRIHKPALIWPLEPRGLRAFATGLEAVMVVEEKRPFVEDQIRASLYGTAAAPEVVGKRDETGRPLVPAAGALEADQLVEPLRRVLARRVPADRLAAPRERIAVSAGSGRLPSRTPYFCSGCPHNRSTTVPEGSVAGGGIGCHGMAVMMDGRATAITQMGGEGAQWVGQAPFVDEAHRFQNLGDGTLAHSGILAIRQAVAAGTNITYKILYNGVVAMTGGQQAAGELAVPELTRELDAEGVARVVVVADDPGKYPDDADFAPGARVVHRDELDAVQLELREVPGTTVLVYDQACAADLRRGRKRGRLAAPTTRVFINEAVCDGCGHCGLISNCISVHPVETPLGRKTRIHQESCNFDLTCVGGECPAFLTVEIDEADRRPLDPDAAQLGLDRPPPPDPDVPDSASLLTVGIGGTGVVTVNQLLTTAALLDGKTTTALDQTGLAQKGGPVVSHLRVGHDHEGASRLAEGGADTYLVFDVVAGVSRANLARTDPERTVAVVSSSRVPTGQMVSRRTRERFPELDRFRRGIDATTRADANVWIDAEAIAKSVFRSQPAANLVVLGVAYQRGLLPVSAAAIERAIELNGVAVETNTRAFRLGRQIGHDASILDDLAVATPDEGPPRLAGAAAAMLESIDADDRLRDTLAWRLPELVGFEDEAWAQRYVDTIGRLRRRELAIGQDRSELSVTVAHQLAKLMTYKDEYEVARLHRRPELVEEVRRRFGPNARIFFQLKPPTLARVGVDRKIAMPERAAQVMFGSLARMKWLRGRRADPFARTDERRIERELIVEYESLVDEIAAGVRPDRYDAAVALAALADQIRGFGEVKLANVARYRAELDDALDAWRQGVCDPGSTRRRSPGGGR